MSKRTLLLVVALIVSVAIAATGTLAYLTATDSDVNVMTLGDVQIEQLEKKRTDDFIKNSGHTGTLVDGDLTDFVDNVPLYPAHPAGGEGSYTAETSDLLYWGPYVTAEGAGNGLWDDKKLVGAVDKMVFVENTGSSPAYYRTILAFECPEGVEYSEGSDKQLMMNVNGHDLFDWEEYGYITLSDGQRYLVMIATYQKALAPGEISLPSLLQVVMTHNADSEDVQKMGETYEIIALSQAVQTDNMPDAETALNAAFEVTEANLIEWLDTALDEDATPPMDHWDGTVDTTWYNDTDTEFVITTAEQLAGLAKLVDEGNTFEGKTIKLDNDICLGCDECKTGDEATPFEPIGSYRKDTPFKGTFDGQNNTIYNLHQNTWALDNGYYYGDLGLGLFGKVEDATVQNLIMDGAEISGESAICGTVAATAYGDCVFDNITVKNSNVADYQYYAGGVVGWASGDHLYTNINVEASTNIAAQWGDFDNSVGGVIGGCGSSATITLKDSSIACRIDAYNDVTSTYQWYAYRRAGMIIGNPGKTKAVNGTTYADAPQLTCENVTVTYGEWANYTYCEFAGTSWPYVRVQEGVSNSAYSNPRYGHPTDANGNEVVDDNHTHNDGEDHFIECTFDQLYGGGQGVYGEPAHTGVTVVYNNK